MNDEDIDMMERLVAVAKARFDGHLTIMRFTHNWRVGFYQAQDREQIQEMACGTTLAEAAEAALRAVNA
ncbi:hypothetical protein [Corallococcus sicarius]|uniref:Uncharacterized protein n=1 Tax=Corallococcus sicarius TaxID=2316726 RepID=A0A3A8N905_9BACT|nr:hypothetical protein [Corallococcus sicarius]RKH39940.1 hypothetical protein D7X12_22115 [Corallococcus sicarius]